MLDLWHQGRGARGATDDVAGLTRLLQRDPDSLLVAELEGRVVASLIAAWDGWRGNMYRLTVDPAYRRRGIASRLVAAGERRFRELGARRISALVWREDGRATSTWLSAGYEDDEGTGRFVKTVG